MNAETKAALTECERLLLDKLKATRAELKAALAHITDLQNGGERAKVVALLDAMASQHITRDMKHKTPQDEGAFEALARAAIRVKAGAHLDGGE